MTTLKEVRARFARDQGLPFADSLSETSILDALNEHGFDYRDRVFGPVTHHLPLYQPGPSMMTRVAVTPYPGSLPIAPQAALQGVFAKHRQLLQRLAARIPTGVLRYLAKGTAQQLQAGLP